MAIVDIRCTIEANYQSRQLKRVVTAAKLPFMPTTGKVMLREGSWLFVRGPLPRGAVAELKRPWRVLSWL